MALITAPTDYLEGITRQQLFRKLAVSTGLLQTGIATNGGVDFLEDTTKLKSTQYDSSEWIGGWLRVAQTSGNLAPENEIAPIPDYQPELGHIDLNPFLTAPIQAGDLYELWRIDPSIVKDIVDDVLTDTLYTPTWSILSEVSDFDMEKSGVTDYTDVGATSTKASATPVTYGRYLHVVSSIAGGYTRTAILGTEPGKSICFGVAVRAGVGATAKLTLWDETHAVEIASQTSIRLYPIRMIVTRAQIPAGCYSISLRMGLVESGVSADFDDLMLYASQSEDIALPSWIRNESQVKGIFELIPQSFGTDIFDAVLSGEHDSRWDILPGRPFRAKARVGVLQHPLFMFGIKPETTYSNDNTDLKFLDNAMFLSCIKWKIYDYLQQPLVSGILNGDRTKAQLASAYQEYQLLMQQQAEEINKIIKSPTPSGRFLDSRFRYGA